MSAVGLLVFLAVLVYGMLALFVLCLITADVERRPSVGPLDYLLAILGITGFTMWIYGLLYLTAWLESRPRINWDRLDRSHFQGVWHEEVDSGAVRSLPHHR